MFSVLCRIIGFRSCFKTSILELGTERLWLVTLVVEDALGSHRMVCLGRCSEPDEYNVDLCCTIALGLVTWAIAASGRSYLVLLGDLLKAGHVQSSFLDHLPLTVRHPQVTRETNGSAAFPGVLAISHPPPPDAVPGELSAGCWYCCPFWDLPPFPFRYLWQFVLLSVLLQKEGTGCSNTLVLPAVPGPCVANFDLGYWVTSNFWVSIYAEYSTTSCW